MIFSHADHADHAEFLQLTITFLADYCISHRFHRFSRPSEWASKARAHTDFLKTKNYTLKTVSTTDFTNFASKREQCQTMEQREQRYMLAWYLCRVVTEFAESKPRLSIAEREQSQDRDSGINCTNAEMIFSHADLADHADYFWPRIYTDSHGFFSKN